MDSLSLWILAVPTATLLLLPTLAHSWEPQRLKVLFDTGSQLSLKRCDNSNVTQDSALPLGYSGGAEYWLTERSAIQLKLVNARRRLNFFDAYFQVPQELKLSGIQGQLAFVYRLESWLLIDAGVYSTHESSEPISIVASDGSANFSGYSIRSSDSGPFLGLSARHALGSGWEAYADLHYLRALQSTLQGAWGDPLDAKIDQLQLSIGLAIPLPGTESTTAQ